MNQLVTIFTPLYNRKDLLVRLYESLTQQTCRAFEWIICDDCSVDGSYEKAKELAETEDRFPIRVIRPECNGGKHRAINLGAAQAEGYLFFIVDSDDLLTPEAVERILFWEETIRQEPSFAGIGFLKADLSKNLIGTTFAEDFCDCTSMERDQHNIGGDKAEVFYTEVIRKYPFPEFEGENFLGESVVWNQIARDGLKLRWNNEIIYLCEYQPDGLTARWHRNAGSNPNGYAFLIRQEMDFRKCTGYTRFHMVYDYYYTVNLAKKRTMKYACEQLDYPLWKAYCYMPIRKGLRILYRLKMLLRRFGTRSATTAV